MSVRGNLRKEDPDRAVVVDLRGLLVSLIAVRSNGDEHKPIEDGHNEVPPSSTELIDATEDL